MLRPRLSHHSSIRSSFSKEEGGKYKPPPQSRNNKSINKHDGMNSLVHELSFKLDICFKFDLWLESRAEIRHIYLAA